MHKPFVYDFMGGACPVETVRFSMDIDACIIITQCEKSLHVISHMFSAGMRGNGIIWRFLAQRLNERLVCPMQREGGAEDAPSFADMLQAEEKDKDAKQPRCKQQKDEFCMQLCAVFRWLITAVSLSPDSFDDAWTGGVLLDLAPQISDMNHHGIVCRIVERLGHPEQSHRAVTLQKSARGAKRAAGNFVFRISQLHGNAVSADEPFAGVNSQIPA